MPRLFIYVPASSPSVVSSPQSLVAPREPPLSGITPRTFMTSSFL